MSVPPYDNHQWTWQMCCKAYIVHRSQRLCAAKFHWLLEGWWLQGCWYPSNQWYFAAEPTLLLGCWQTQGGHYASNQEWAGQIPHCRHKFLQNDRCFFPHVFLSLKQRYFFMNFSQPLQYNAKVLQLPLRTTCICYLIIALAATLLFWIQGRIFLDNIYARKVEQMLT